MRGHSSRLHHRLAFCVIDKPQAEYAAKGGCVWPRCARASVMSTFRPRSISVITRSLAAHEARILCTPSHDRFSTPPVRGKGIDPRQVKLERDSIRFGETPSKMLATTPKKASV